MLNIYCENTKKYGEDFFDAKSEKQTHGRFDSLFWLLLLEVVRNPRLDLVDDPAELYDSWSLLQERVEFFGSVLQEEEEGALFYPVRFIEKCLSVFSAGVSGGGDTQWENLGFQYTLEEQINIKKYLFLILIPFLLPEACGEDALPELEYRKDANTGSLWISLKNGDWSVFNRIHSYCESCEPGGGQFFIEIMGNDLVLFFPDLGKASINHFEEVHQDEYIARN